MKKLVTMREALRDRHLLGDALPGDSWSAWRTLLIAACGEPLTDAERVTFKALTGRDRESGEMVETLLVVAGRRSGKTKAMGTLSVYFATLCDWSGDLSLGERGLAAAEAEFGGQFRQPVTAYLDRTVVEKAVDRGITGRTRLPGVTYRAHIDVAGGTGSDSFCVCIGHKMHDAGRDICVVDALFEARPPFDPDVITEQAATLLRQWGVSDATGDAYAAAWPITAFAKHGIRFHTAALTTSELYLHTLPLWTAGRVSMLDVPRAVDQLCNLRRKVGQGGKENITHPRNAHDVLSCVIAGLLWRLTPVVARKPKIVSPSVFSNGIWWDAPVASGQRQPSTTQLFYQNGGYGGGARWPGSGPTDW
jgi:hypothetical protein